MNIINQGKEEGERRILLILQALSALNLELNVVSKSKGVFKPLWFVFTRLTLTSFVKHVQQLDWRKRLIKSQVNLVVKRI